jgi:hypothetical protein
MANNCKVKVQVEIEECADTVTDGPRKESVGVFEWVVSAEQAHSIDECEQIVLQTNYAALRDAFAHHLSAVSQQHALEVAGSLEECEVKPYRVDGEVGRITFESYWVEQDGGGHSQITVSGTAREGVVSDHRIQGSGDGLRHHRRVVSQG